MANLQTTQTFNTYLHQKSLKEALETLLPFSGDKYPIKKGLKTNGLENTILFDLTHNFLVFTDFVRFAIYPLEQVEENLFSTSLKGKYLIHTEFAKSLQKSLTKRSKTPIRVKTDDENIYFVTDKETISASLVKEPFPEYEKELLSGWEGCLTFNLSRKSFLEKLEECSLESNFITLAFKDNSVYLYDAKEKDSIPVILDLEENNPSQEVKIPLFYKYLKGTVKKQKTDNISFIFQDPSKINENGFSRSIISIEGSFDSYIAPIALN